MKKASISCLEKDSHGSRIRLSSSQAIHDIIATDNDVLKKESQRSRLSRLCKTIIFFVTLVLIVAGVVALTLVLAHARNNLVATLARSAEANAMFVSNESRTLNVNQENLTTRFDEGKNDYRQTSTVTLTSDHFNRFTTETVHPSSTMMRTKQSNEQKTSTVLSMKPYPSTNTMDNEQSTTLTTVQTTTSNEMTTERERTSSEAIETEMMTEYTSTTTVTITSTTMMTSSIESSTKYANNEFLSSVFAMIANESETRDDLSSTDQTTSFSTVITTSTQTPTQTSTQTSTPTPTPTLNHDELMSISQENLPTTNPSHDINEETSTMKNVEEITETSSKTPFRRAFSKFVNEDDILSDFLFS